jgi:hypothetical protein
VVVCVGQRCVRVVHPTIILHESTVLVLGWILFGTLKKHMLQEVGSPEKWLRVEGATDSHID